MERRRRFIDGAPLRGIILLRGLHLCEDIQGSQVDRRGNEGEYHIIIPVVLIIDIDNQSRCDPKVPIARFGSRSALRHLTTISDCHRSLSSAPPLLGHHSCLQWCVAQANTLQNPHVPTQCPRVLLSRLSRMGITSTSRNLRVHLSC